MKVRHYHLIMYVQSVSMVQKILNHYKKHVFSCHGKEILTTDFSKKFSRFVTAAFFFMGKFVY